MNGGATLAALPLVWHAVASHAQGNLTLGFENELRGSIPAYVRVTSANSQARVADASTFATIPPFAGAQYLYGTGAISLASPSGEAIKSFSLAFLAIPNLNSGNRFQAGGEPVVETEFNRWTTVARTLDTPVSEIAISGFSTPDGQTFVPTGFAIDNVTLETVPEPSLASIAILGLCIFAHGKLRFSREPH